MKKRLDVLIFERGLVSSRVKSQAIIMAGLVFVDGKKETKPGASFDDTSDILVTELPRYVGRGADKISGVAEGFDLDFGGKIVADIGSSTGGFTDFALQHGAKKVYAIDVGTGQLDWRLRSDSRVIVMEKTDFRKIKKLPEKIDIFLVDVSFISLRKILEHIKTLRHSAAGKQTTPQTINDPMSIVALFKPQFEAGKKIADKFRGVIDDPEIHQELLSDFSKWCDENGFEVLDKIASPILGAKGNKEFFFKLRIKE